MEHKDFLVEIGTEELPPKALKSLAETFYTGIQAGLASAGIHDTSGDYYFSPRRLSVCLRALPDKQADVVQERLGPAVQAAFDKAGKPSKAAEGFAASVGTSVDKLQRKTTDKGERLACTLKIPGKPLPELLPDIVAEALKKLPVPKRMRWGAGDAEFVRPVHWIVMLFGKELVTCELFGIKAGRETFGHRFHAPAAIVLRSPDEYPTLLEQRGHVRVNDQNGGLSRQIRKMTSEEATKAGGKPENLDSGLADEIAALTEWPVPVVGDIPERFMTLPEEVLITTIETHQRYFPIRGSNGKLLPKFITFANIESKQPDTVRQGNERVITPRLQDAAFFWELDRKTPLAARIPELDRVVFQKQLGSYGDKSRRVATLAAAIAAQLGADQEQVTRAAALAKCDLLSNLVGEFPELQGTMGKYFALHDGEPAEVAQAIEEQYLPRFAGDRLPQSKAGQALAIADKLDTVSGIFAAGQAPSGDKDPFALRRQALGVLRIIIESRLELDLSKLITFAIAQFKHQAEQGELLAVLNFFMERLRAYYLEQGIRKDVFEAVMAREVMNPSEFNRRIAGMHTFMQLPEAANLAAANKRISNILRQADATATKLDPALFETSAEISLLAAITSLDKEIAPFLKTGDYTAVLSRLAALRSPVDAFFEKVMVLAEDPVQRGNRLALLGRLQNMFLQIADLSRIQVE
jgi:glycyl-tRNA synthetase beta chain